MSLSYFNFPTHHKRSWKRTKVEEKILGNDYMMLESTVLASVSAPAVHKAKLLVELQSLRKQQERMLHFLNKKLENPESIISNEKIYLENIGEDNRAIKQIEDELRKVFVSENLDPSLVKKGNDLLVNIYELYLPSDID
jgi:hypothetical protein